MVGMVAWAHNQAIGRRNCKMLKENMLGTISLIIFECMIWNHEMHLVYLDTTDTFELDFFGIERACLNDKYKYSLKMNQFLFNERNLYLNQIYVYVDRLFMKYNTKTYAYGSHYVEVLMFGDNQLYPCPLGILHWHRVVMILPQCRKVAINHMGKYIKWIDKK